MLLRCACCTCPAVAVAVGEEGWGKGRWCSGGGGGRGALDPARARPCTWVWSVWRVWWWLHMCVVWARVHCTGCAWFCACVVCVMDMGWARALVSPGRAQHCRLVRPPSPPTPTGIHTIMDEKELRRTALPAPPPAACAIPTHHKFRCTAPTCTSTSTSCVRYDQLP